MNRLKAVMIAMLLFGGSAALAARPSSSGEDARDLQTISSWMAHLNRYYPAVEVAPAGDLANPSTRAQTLRDLDQLEGFLRGEATVPTGGLKAIACAKPVCDGGGGGGKCSSCSLDED